MGGSASNEELLSKVIEMENVPEDVQSVMHSDGRQTKLNYNLAWAKTYLKRVKAIDNSMRGVWSITDIGERMKQEDMEAVPAKVRKQDYNRRRKDSQAEPKTETPPPPSSDDLAEERASEEDWKDQLLAIMRDMPPPAFERLAQRILREAGFVKVEVLGKSGDGGIDGVGVLRVNLLSFQVLFQCKRYQGTVGSSAVRDFRGGMVGRSDKGLIITTGTFSSEAKREATRDGAPAIDLIDGNQLCDLLKNLELGVSKRLVETVEVNRLWFDGV
jgi:restriction system protein